MRCWAPPERVELILTIPEVKVRGSVCLPSVHATGSGCISASPATPRPYSVPERGSQQGAWDGSLPTMGGCGESCCWKSQTGGWEPAKRWLPLCSILGGVTEREAPLTAAATHHEARLLSGIMGWGNPVEASLPPASLPWAAAPTAAGRLRPSPRAAGTQRAAGQHDRHLPGEGRGQRAGAGVVARLGGTRRSPWQGMALLHASIAGTRCGQ